MNKAFNPKSVAAPQGVYSHGILVPPGSRLLYIAGQIGVRPDGSIGPTIQEQAEAVWQNITAVLAEGGMVISDIVKITTFLTRQENYALFAPIRAKYLGAHRPASTLVVVQSLARPEFLVEVEAVAAKAAPAARASRPPRRPARRVARRPAKRTIRKKR